jgi:hypothetical protein
VSRLRKIFPLVVTLAAALFAPSAGAAITTCANSGASALDQYCEVVPSSTGGQAPQAGLPTLATTLSPQSIQRIIAASGAQRVATGAQNGTAGRRRQRSTARHRSVLLTLPAAESRRPTSTIVASDTSLWSISGWMLGVLALLAIGLGGAAWSRRRRRPPPLA